MKRPTVPTPRRQALLEIRGGRLDGGRLVTSPELVVGDSMEIDGDVFLLTDRRLDSAGNLLGVLTLDRRIA